LECPESTNIHILYHIVILDMHNMMNGHQ